MRTIWTLSIALCLFAQTAAAQDTETGSTVEQTTATGTLLVELQERLQNNLVEYAREASTLRITSNAQERYDTLRTRLIERLWQHRAQCRADIRRSNRDARIRTIGRCMDTDLEIQKSILKEEQAFIHQLPVLDEKLTSKYDTAVTELIDAQKTIQNALDAQVFESESTLLQAILNLSKRYRAPKKLALLHLTSRRELSWISTIVSTWNKDIVEESQINNRYRALTCLKDVKDVLENILQSKTIEKAIPLQEQANVYGAECRLLLQQSLTADTPKDTTE